MFESNFAGHEGKKSLLEDYKVRVVVDMCARVCVHVHMGMFYQCACTLIKPHVAEDPKVF